MVVKEIYPDVKSSRVGYPRVNSELRKILKKKPDILIIADLWPSDEKGLYIELADFPGRLLVFDHHDTTQSEQLRLFDMRRANGFKVEQHTGLTPFDKGKLKVAKFHLDNTSDGHVYGNGNCSAKLASWFLKVDWMPMIDEVNIFDMTGTTQGLPGALNYLFYALPRGDMRLLLKRKKPRMNAYEQDALYAELAKCENDFNMFAPTMRNFHAKGKHIITIEADKSKSFIFDKVLEECDFIVLLDRSKNAISIRGKYDGVNRVAEQLGGGGHDKAAGAPWDNVTMEHIINIFSEVLE
jgi:hypothetical protein